MITITYHYRDHEYVITTCPLPLQGRFQVVLKNISVVEFHAQNLRPSGKEPMTILHDLHSV